MTIDEIKPRFEAELKKLPFGYESMTVFGTIRLNVHITCISEATARKWALALAKLGKVSMVPTVWNAKENKGSSLLPTMRKGYLIGLIVGAEAPAATQEAGR